MININGKEWDDITLYDIKSYLSSTDDDETFFTEFKEENIRNNQLTKEISAFANSYGGYLFLGIDDSKNIKGCTNEWTELRINTIVCNGISPTPQFDIKIFQLQNTRKLFVIKIEEGIFPPYITNNGYIYHRVSSSSDKVKDASILNYLYQKRKDNIKAIEQKLYIPAISGTIPDNLCGYIDYGFSLTTKNKKETERKIRDFDITSISKKLKTRCQKYSISKVGYSISITIGEACVNSNEKRILTNAGLTNFMEILPDGSVRCRVVLASRNDEESITDISHISFSYSIFSEIYQSIFGNSFAKNFIEAQGYEKLTVLKQFQPIIQIDEYEKKNNKIFYNYCKNHTEKYGNNIIVNSNRIPMSGFFTIDKSQFELNGTKFSSENLYSQLFFTNYMFLGYIDKFPETYNG